MPGHKHALSQHTKKKEQQRINLVNGVGLPSVRPLGLSCVQKLICVMCMRLCSSKNTGLSHYEGTCPEGIVFYEPTQLLPWNAVPVLSKWATQISFDFVRSQVTKKKKENKKESNKRIRNFSTFPLFSFSCVFFYNQVRSSTRLMGHFIRSISPCGSVLLLMLLGMRQGYVIFLLLCFESI